MAETLNLGTDGNWGVKKDSLLAYNSENNNFKPLPFDFTRASSATVVNKAGLIETVGSGEPRIDFKDDANGALLLEPTRSNLITYSEDFSNAIWTNTSAAISVNPTADLSPDGTLTGNEFNEGTSSGRKAIFEDLSVTANQINTLSVFVKKGTSNYLRLVIAENGDSGDWTAVQVDLSDNSLIIGNGSNNSFTDISSSISSVDYNGYYRLQLSAKHPTATSLRLLFCTSNGNAISPSNSYGRPDYTGTNKTVFVWGCQMETNSSYATSYIPTSGSAVTRSKDDINTSLGTVLPLSGEASVYIESLGQPVTGINNTGKTISVGFDPIITGQSYVSLNFTGTEWRARVQDGSSSNFINLAVSQTEKIKIVLVLRPTTYALYANGSLIGSETRAYNGTAPVITSIGFVGYDSTNSDFGITRNKDLRVYNTALSSAEAIALTAI